MTSIISGIYGMDARNLAAILLRRGHRVIGTHRYSSAARPAVPGVELRCVDSTDASGVTRLVAEIQPDMIFNLAALSHVGESFGCPGATLRADAEAVLNWLEAIRLESGHTRFYQADTSETFGKNYEVVGGVPTQTETTARIPSSPYGVAKLAAYHLVRIYREAYGIYAVSGTLFNHTDVTRTPSFFERKVSVYSGKFRQWAARNFVQSRSDLIIGGETITSRLSGDSMARLPLGITEGVYRDIGWSPDYMAAALLMMGRDEPRDYLVASGEAYPITRILELALTYNDIGWNDLTYVSPELIRPVDVPYLRGDSQPIREELGWKPTRTFDELIRMLIEHDAQPTNTY